MRLVRSSASPGKPDWITHYVPPTSYHMWTAPSCKGVGLTKVIVRLRSYVRPVGAAARDRWPRWYPQCGFQTASRPVMATETNGLSRTWDRLITPSALRL